MRRFIANLPLARKFLVIGFIAALMLLVPTTLLVRGDLAKLSAAHEQSAGLTPARVVVALMHLTQQHRGLSAVQLGGDASALATRQAKRAEVDEALSRVMSAVDALKDASLQSAAARIADDWRTLAGAVDGKMVDPAQSLGRHTDLIASQLDLLEDITHVSGIVLVPDAGAYFLQDAVLQQLPRLTEAFGQARGLGAALLSRGSAAPEERAKISQLAATVQFSLNESRKLLDLATKGDTTAHAAIGAAIKSAMDAAQTGLKVVDARVVRAEKLDFPASEYFDITTRAIESQFKLIDVAMTALDAALQREVSEARSEIAVVLAVCSALALFALWVMWVVTRVTTSSMSSALRLAEAVAAGDLTVAVEDAGRDEAGQVLRALSRMKDSLAGVVGSVRGNAESVATASAQIAQGNLDLSQRTEEQASALEETAASMEQLGSTVKQNADNARQANQLAQSASAVAAQGGDVVNDVVQTMKGINDSSRRIADIIGTIDSIAFQTNILALNAAVEAARAGEQGRGFAVVASEVRSLAQRSAEAAREIKALITASVEQVDQGTVLVDKAGSTMQQVVSSIKRVTDIMGEISSASVEQSAGVSQVGEAVSQMDQVTQQNAALVEESAAAAESLRAQAQQLVMAVAVFKLEAASTSPSVSGVLHRTTSAATRPVPERRGPNRAANVSRLPIKGKAPAVVRSSTEARHPVDPPSARTGTDDWETF